MEAHEYIKREDALKAVNYAGPRERASLVDVALMVAYTKINSIPAADVVEVVRCKDCQNCEVIYPVKIIEYEPEEVYYCKAHNGSRNPKDFCSYGRRKDETSSR